MIQNPKLVSTRIVDCIPQKGGCPNSCNQCFFNRSGAFYVSLDQLPNIPTPVEVGNRIVRMNCGHDSNLQRDLVIKTAKQYKDVFFNTSISALDFPGPVVFTANPKEEEPAVLLQIPPKNLMFIRLRTSGTNLTYISEAVEHYSRKWHIPVVLTFMAYYDKKPKIDSFFFDSLNVDDCYTWKIRHINPYWCPTSVFMARIMRYFRANRLVSMCGSYESAYCKDCLNCETYYYQAKKRLANE